MSQKLNAGSVELETAFIEWVRNNAYDPTEAIDHFMARSEYIRNAVEVTSDQVRGRITDRARLHLQRLSEDTVFTAQFPMVYACENLEGKKIRYTVSLTIGEDQAQWVGRVWADDRFLGDIQGSGSGPKANYMELARMHVEAHISCPGEFAPRLRSR